MTPPQDAGTAAMAIAPRRFFGRLIDSEEWLGWAMIGPAVVYIVLLVGFPFLLALF